MSDEQPEKRHVILPSKRPPSVKRFCRKVRLARGNTCENCGASPEGFQIESHHILAFHEYPELAKVDGNIIVLCQTCHSGLTPPYGEMLFDGLIQWARLKPELRERIASYVEVNAPTLTTFVRIVRAGEEAAQDYYFRNI